MVKSLLYASLSGVLLFFVSAYALNPYVTLSSACLVTLGVNSVLLFCIVFNKSFTKIHHRATSHSEQVWLIKSCVAAFVLSVVGFLLVIVALALLLDSDILLEIIYDPFNIVKVLLLLAGGSPIAAYVGYLAGSHWLHRVLH